jgi:hypothetical protein
MALTMRSTTRSLRGDTVARINFGEGEIDMSIRLLRSFVAVSTLMAALLLTVTFVRGQEQAKAPWQQGLTADGQPDLQGFWSSNPGGTYDITDPRAGGGRLDELLKVRAGEVRVPKPSRVVDPADGKIPYQPWAAAKQKDLEAHVDDPTKPEHIDTQARCFLNGATRGFFHSGFEIVQVPGYVIFLWEQNSEYRVVALDGSPHIGPDIKLWQGDSRGHWDGNTLAIDITNLNAKARLDMVGNFYSDKAHVVERLTRVDEKTIRYEAVVTDPTVYTRPWTIATKFVRGHIKDANYELWEDACHEGERSAEKMIIPANVLKENEDRAKAVTQNK